MNLMPQPTYNPDSNGNDTFSTELPHLPTQLRFVVKADAFVGERHRWNTNEEVASVLIAFDKHALWQTKEIIIRPPSGTMLLYNRKIVRYRKDGYCWKKRKDGKTTREDHMKLKVQGNECIYGCYVHSSILPTFHRRCYWLLQNPDIVLVHYLNMPLTRNNNLCCIPSVSFDCRMSKEELESQIRPMFASLKHFAGNMTEISVQSIITLLAQKNCIDNARISLESQPSIPPTFEPTYQQSNKILVSPQTSSQIDKFNIQEGQVFAIPEEKEHEDISISSEQSHQKDALLDILSPERFRYQLEDFFSLADFPVTFDDLETNTYQLKRELDHKEGNANRIHNTIDDLDDILNIVTTNLQDSFHSTEHYAGKLYTSCSPVEFSPRWSYTEGGEKMLITGKFEESTEYIVLFGSVGVSGEAIQNGVIKCIIPAVQKEGTVELKVMKDNVLVSQCGNFQYKPSHITQFDMQDQELVQILWEKIQSIKEQLCHKQDVAVMDCLVKLLQRLFPHSKEKICNQLNLSLLHLVSALGDAEMIWILTKARGQENISEIIKSEVNPMSEDAYGNIPMVWACARGKLEAFLILFQNCPHSMTSSNSLGQSPIHFIQQSGKSFFTFYQSSFPLICNGGSFDKSTQTESQVHKINDIAFEITSDSSSKWPTDDDLTLPYRRSLQGQAPTLFGDSRAKDYFREQCRKDTLVKTQTCFDFFKICSEKFHNRSESLTEDIFDFQISSKQNFRSANSEPLLMEQNSFSKMDPVMQDSTSDITDFSALDKFDVEFDIMSSEHMMTLASHIIAAIPMRNKSYPSQIGEGDSMFQGHSNFSINLGVNLGGAEDSGIGTPMEGISSLPEYRHGLTQMCALSPASTRVSSPHQYGLPCETIDFADYFNAPTTYMEEDFSLLTLSDDEQRKLYEAAKIIQNFYKKHKDERSARRLKEIEAAVLIQNCYRRYKQFLQYRRMNQAAVLIQSRFRSYYARKRYRRSKEAATLIQNRYRAYKEHQKYKRNKNAFSTIQQRFRNHHQATSLTKCPLLTSVHKFPEASDGLSQKNPAISNSDKGLESAKGNYETS